jgi:hypothetical protein
MLTNSLRAEIISREKGRNWAQKQFFRREK